MTAGAHPAPSGGPATGLDEIGGATIERLTGDVRTRVARELARSIAPDRLLAPSEDDEAQAWGVIAEAVADLNRRRVLERQPPLPVQMQEELGQRVFDALLRFGPLERWLSDPDVEEVILNGHTTRFLVRAGDRKEQIVTGFASEAELHAFAARTVAAGGRRLDEASPAVDMRLPGGSRLHAICPPLAPCTCLTVRRHRLVARSLRELVDLGTLTVPVADLLAAAVRAGLNLLVSGGTATGKTTLLNCLAAEIPPGHRVVTIEETKELVVDQVLPDCVPLEARFANSEGVGEVRQRELVRHALRMRPHRVVVGEVRGGEALDMLVAMNSGHAGSAGTIHADSARQALSKLRTLTRFAPESPDAATVTDMIGDTIDLVCQLAFVDGRRVLVEVAETAGVEGGRVLLNQLVLLDPAGRPAWTGLQPRAADRLLRAGWHPANLDPELSGRRW
jgi:pilus assembly protein CpaF